MTRPVRARIDLPALQHNFERVRQCAPASRIMAVVKAHAYGHGLVNAARSLPGADAFGVVSMDEKTYSTVCVSTIFVDGSSILRNIPTASS